MHLLRLQLAYALPFAGTAMLGLLRDRAHAYYVASEFSAATFAIYAVGLLNIPLLGLLTQTVGEFVILQGSPAFASGATRRIRRIWHAATYELAFLLIPCVMLAEVFASDIIRLLFGDAYLAATPIFRAYLLLVPLSLILVSPMLRAAGELRTMLIADVASAVASLAALPPLVHRLGPLGAVLSLVLGNLVFTIVGTNRVMRRVGLTALDILPWKRLALLCAVGTLASVAAAVTVAFGTVAWGRGVSQHPPFVQTAIRLMIGGMLGALLVVAGSWRLGLVPHRIRESVTRAVLIRPPWRRASVTP